MLQVDITHLQVQRQVLEKAVRCLERQQEGVSEIRDRLGKSFPQQRILWKLTQIAGQITAEKQRLRKLADTLEKIQYIYVYTEEKVVAQAEGGSAMGNIVAGIHDLDYLNTYLNGISIRE